jgi:hypothetical protein
VTLNGVRGGYSPIMVLAWIVAAFVGGLTLLFSAGPTYTHLTGPRVIATVDYCSDRPRPRVPCGATWTLRGIKDSGWIEGVYAGYEDRQVRAIVINDTHVMLDEGLLAAAWPYLLFAAVALAFVVSRLFVLRRRYRGTDHRLGRNAYVWGVLSTLGGLVVGAGLALVAIGSLEQRGQAVPWGTRIAAAGLLPLAAGVPLALRLHRANRRTAIMPTSPATAPMAGGAPIEFYAHRLVRLADVVQDAIRLAHREGPTDQPLTTGRLLAALRRADMRTDWQRIWLYTGDPDRIGLADEPDPPVGDPATHWNGIPLSDRLARALGLLDRLSSAYQWERCGSGATMLALVADAGNGATRALLRGGGVTHSGLLRLVQSDLIKTTLAGLRAYIPAAY